VASRCSSIKSWASAYSLARSRRSGSTSPAPAPHRAGTGCRAAGPARGPPYPARMVAPADLVDPALRRQVRVGGLWCHLPLRAEMGRLQPQRRAERRRTLPGVPINVGQHLVPEVAGDTGTVALQQETQRGLAFDARLALKCGLGGRHARILVGGEPRAYLFRLVP